MNSVGITTTCGRRAALLFATVSVTALVGFGSAWAQEAPNVEEVLVTGSLIRGAAAVGVPVTAIGAEDFRQTATTNISDLLRSVPQVAVIQSGAQGAATASQTRSARVAIHNLGLGGTSPGAYLRSLVLYNGMRYPATGTYVDGYDPQIVPAISVQRIDVLADGASATYGSDAVAGVINVIMKRGVDGAETQLQYDWGYKGGSEATASQLYGKTWSGGDITISLSYSKRDPIWGRDRKYQTLDFTPWGLDNRIPLRSASPAIVSVPTAGNATGTALLPGGSTAGSPTLASDPFGTQGIGCANCFDSPRGAATAVGVPLNFSQFTPMTKTTNNLEDIWKVAQLQGPQERLSTSLVFDQDITNDIQMFVDTFFAHRTAPIIQSINQQPYSGGLISGIGLPSPASGINPAFPYYPTGAPSALKLNLTFADLISPEVHGKASSFHFDGGVNLNLPYDWHGKLTYGVSQENSDDTVTGDINPNNVDAVFGRVAGDILHIDAPYMIADPATAGLPFGTRLLTAADKALNSTLAGYPVGTPVRVISTATVPFLNPFCDPLAACTDPKTLAFINGYFIDTTRYAQEEFNASFDGPVADLPGGPLRAAIGGSFVRDAVNATHSNNAATASTETPNNAIFSDKHDVWAVFGQVNVPLIGKDNAIPLFQRLDVEVSGRYDSYSDVGGTSNYKFGLSWSPIEDLVLRASDGTSFRAPGFGELGNFFNKFINLTNSNGNNTTPTCPGGVAGGTPVPGSIGALINPTCSANTALMFPLIALQNGGAVTSYGITRDNGIPRMAAGTLRPEQAYNFTMGLGYAPTNFLKGLDLQATYFQTSIHDYISNPSVPATRALTTAGAAYAFLVKANPAAGIAGDPADPNNVVFNKALTAYLASPVISSFVAAQSGNIEIIQDTMFRNLHKLYQSGIDFSGRYDWDMADLGQWTVGLNGTYLLKETAEEVVDAGTTDLIKDPITSGTDLIRVHARGQLGWADESTGWDVNAFVNYQSHYYTNGALPIQQIQAVICPTCALNDNLFRIVPSFYTFDLTVGYDFADRPANEYLKGTRLQVTANNITNRQPPFVGASSPFDAMNFRVTGRVVSFIITKNW